MKKLFQFLCSLNINHSYTRTATYRRTSGNIEEYSTCKYCNKTGFLLKKLSKPGTK